MIYHGIPRVAKCHIFYTDDRTILSKQILPHEKCVICDKSNIWIEWNWDRWLLKREKSFKYGWFKDKTTSKLVEFIQKLLHFTKRRGLPIYFLPQPSNIFIQIYLPFWHLWHLWHFATLISDKICWGCPLSTGQCPVSLCMFIWELVEYSQLQKKDLQ